MQNKRISNVNENLLDLSSLTTNNQFFKKYILNYYFEPLKEEYPKKSNTSSSRKRKYPFFEVFELNESEILDQLEENGNYKSNSEILKFQKKCEHASVHNKTIADVIPKNNGIKESLFFSEAESLNHKSQTHQSKKIKYTKNYWFSEEETEDGEDISEYQPTFSEEAFIASLENNPFICSVNCLPEEMNEYIDVQAKIERMVVNPKIIDSKKFLSPQFLINWQTLIQNELPNYYKQMISTRTYLQQNATKIAELCKKEIRKKQQRSSKANKESRINKSKKLVKELGLFWKKLDKEEREAKKKAEKEAIEKRKHEEEIREAKRQQRKLNFLLKQTELYSHFLGKKMRHFRDLDNSEEVKVVRIPVLSENESKQEQEEQYDENEDEILKQHAIVNVEKAFKEQVERVQEFDENINRIRSGVEGGPPGKKRKILSSSSLDQVEEAPIIKQPANFKGELKSYQLKGLSWIINLYDQGINGILADEMGLGKTIQTIAVLSHLAEEKDIWGPFLIIAPVSTLYNWYQELTKFCPTFQVLPYWGPPKERQLIRKFWDPKKLYTRDSPFHILITSYNFAVQDERYFHRIHWQYMVLDEAQFIKSSSSARWKSLLSFKCRNRLLLTGTPIQNSMAELWALLHFIMPTLFDSHEEFNEWFSKDIENHATGQTGLNEHQLNRLHLILKPFMLRRVKQAVESEIGEKIEVEIECELTPRQRRLYQGIKDKIKINELLEHASGDAMETLMNLVMQFRKVCNHPDIFERGYTRSPFQFQIPPPFIAITRKGSQIPFVTSINHNPISFQIPKILFREVLENGPIENKKWLINKLFSIYSPANIHSSIFSKSKTGNLNTFSFTRLINLSPAELQNFEYMEQIDRWYNHVLDTPERTRKISYINENRLFKVPSLYILSNSPCSPSYIEDNSVWKNLIIYDPAERHRQNKYIYDYFQIYYPAVWAPPISYSCSDRSFYFKHNDSLNNSRVKTMLLGLQNDSSLMQEKNTEFYSSTYRSWTSSCIWVPDLGKLLSDSGKLKQLDILLTKLKQEGHRVLIYSQMTKMIDILEDFMLYRKHRYIRLDGSSKLSERRDLVEDWQTKPELFVFLLSTRAGGLGINLTAADTVIFYDSDWNPTMDQQAMDRAHRLGQTKTVTVYRLVTKNSIEERILKRAKQKHAIQSLVISGGDFQASLQGSTANHKFENPTEVVSLLLGDEEVEENVKKQLEARSKKRSRGRSSIVPPAKKEKKSTEDMEL